MQNEKADEKAKEAAQGDTSAKHLIPKALRGAIPWSKSAIQQKFHGKLRCRTQKRWRKSQRHAKAAKIDESMPSMKFLALTRMLPRTKASLMLQLRTGHIALNKHLHCIGKSDTPTCPACGLEEETVRHFLVTCPAREGLRGEMRKELGRDAGSMQKLLADPETAPMVLRYVRSTGRLNKVFDLGGRNEKDSVTKRMEETMKDLKDMIKEAAEERRKENEQRGGQPRTAGANTSGARTQEHNTGGDEHAESTPPIYPHI